MADYPHVWLRNGAGEWNGSPTADPLTDTGGVAVGPLSSPLFPFCGVTDVFTGASSVTYNPGGGFAHPLAGATAWGGTWNPSDTTANLSGGNLIASAGAITNEGARGTINTSAFNGLVYFEGTLTFGNDVTCVGLADASASLTTAPSGGISITVDGTGTVFVDTSSVGSLVGVASGSIIGVALLTAPLAGGSRFMFAA